MRKTFIAITILAGTTFFACPLIQAQETAKTQNVSTTPVTDRTSVPENEIELMRSDLRSRRKQVIAKNIEMTDAEAEKFWPIYDRYAADQRKAYDIHYGLLKEYAANEKTLSDAQAASLTKRWTEADNAKAQLRVKYFPEFEKVLGGKRAARLCQLDRMLTLMIDLQIGSEVPLIQP